MVLDLKAHLVRKERLLTEIERLIEKLKQLQQAEDYKSVALVVNQLETKLQQLSALISLAITPQKFMP